MRALLLGTVAAFSLTGFGAQGKIIRFALPNWVEMEFVEVSGSSQLPLTHLYTGKEKEKVVGVSLPTYWIGRFEVTQKQYAAVMGENPSEVKDERLPVTNVRWIDAVTFCDRLNQVGVGEVPQGYRFDLPTMVEWAHAFRCGDTNLYRYAGSDNLDAVAWHGTARAENGVDFSKIHIGGMKDANLVGAYDMSGNVGEFVFLAGPNASNVRIGGSFMWPESYCELTGNSLVVKDEKFPDLGFRVALVPIAGRDPNGTSSAMGTKGRILLESGHSEMARRYLGMALGVNDLGVEELGRIRDFWRQADLGCGSDSGTWKDLTKKLSARLAEYGYPAKPVMDFWEADAAEARTFELRDVLKGYYKSRRIYGMMVTPKDLPAEITQWMAVSDKKVQAVSCDFTGDGLADLLVELPGGANENGDRYGFFERKKAGGYAIVGEPVRTVGLCVIPKEKEGVVFLGLIKVADDVVEPGVLDCTIVGGRACLRVAWPLKRSFSLKELADEKVHPKLPFMGRANALRTANIESGDYLRPLCWPWKR